MADDNVVLLGAGEFFSATSQFRIVSYETGSTVGWTLQQRWQGSSGSSQWENVPQIKLDRAQSEAHVKTLKTE